MLPIETGARIRLAVWCNVAVTDDARGRNLRVLVPQQICQPYQLFILGSGKGLEISALQFNTY